MLTRCQMCGDIIEVANRRSVRLCHDSKERDEVKRNLKHVAAYFCDNCGEPLTSGRERLCIECRKHSGLRDSSQESSDEKMDAVEELPTLRMFGPIESRRSREDSRLD